MVFNGTYFYVFGDELGHVFSFPGETGFKSLAGMVL